MARSKDDPHHTGNAAEGRRKLSWGKMALSLIAFIVGVGLFFTTYSNNPPACYAGGALAFVGAVVFLFTAFRGDRRNQTNGNSA